jgi:hypothetical protein
MDRARPQGAGSDLIWDRAAATSIFSQISHRNHTWWIALPFEEEQPSIWETEFCRLRLADSFNRTAGAKEKIRAQTALSPAKPLK